MRWNIRVLFMGFLFSALLPVTVWGYGFTDYYDDRSYFPYSSAVGSDRYKGSLRLQTSMTEDGYYVRAYLDGLHPDDVQVYLRRNRLVLQAAQGDRYGLYKPNARGASQWKMRFRKQLRLPYDADTKNMTTTTENGIIEIYFPRRSQYRPADPFLERPQYGLGDRSRY